MQMNSILGQHERTISRRLSRHQPTNLYYGKRRNNTNSRLHNENDSYASSAYGGLSSSSSINDGGMTRLSPNRSPYDPTRSLLQQDVHSTTRSRLQHSPLSNREDMGSQHLPPRKYVDMAMMDGGGKEQKTSSTSTTPTFNYRNYNARTSRHSSNGFPSSTSKAAILDDSPPPPQHYHRSTGPPFRRRPRAEMLNSGTTNTMQSLSAPIPPSSSSSVVGSCMNGTGGGIGPGGGRGNANASSLLSRTTSSVLMRGARGLGGGGDGSSGRGGGSMIGAPAPAAGMVGLGGGGGSMLKPPSGGGGEGRAGRWQGHLPDIHPTGGASSSRSSGSSNAAATTISIGAAGSSSGSGTMVGYTTYLPRRTKARHLSPMTVLPIAEPEYVSIGGESCGLCTVKGFKPGNPAWQNQDSYVIVEGGGGEEGGGGGACIYGVLDGHGEIGHLVSNRCRDQLPKYLAQVNNDVMLACRLMQQDLVASRTMDVSCSGATCVLAVLRATCLRVGNLGDSRCVLGRIHKSGAGIVAVPLTRDHKPDRPDEHQRIIAAGGQVGCRQIILSQRTPHPMAVPMGPPRIWYQCRGEIMGLAMSRSLGDAVVHTVGGSSEPEITEYHLVEGDAFLILASDGIWDVVDNAQAIQIIHSYACRSPGGGGREGDWDTKEAANILVRFARQRWQAVSHMVDDITCLVVKLKKQSSSIASSSSLASVSPLTKSGGNGTMPAGA